MVLPGRGPTQLGAILGWRINRCWWLMNEFLTNLSADNPWLWALFVLGVVASSALALSVVTGLLLRLGLALAASIGRRLPDSEKKT